LNNKKIQEDDDLLTMQRVNISDDEIVSMISRLNPDVLNEETPS
jgi:hypothetical protein